MRLCVPLAMPTMDEIKTGLSILGSVVIPASLVTSWTPTPPPGTRLARAYHYLELAALLFGRAKDSGVLPATPNVDKGLADAIALSYFPAQKIRSKSLI
jgi:hypothetical protein